MDHADTAALRRKYAGDAAVDGDEIVATDIVWSTGPLREAIRRALPGADKWFRFVVASHVIEHVPDVIWWLTEVRSVMAPGGALKLIVPDRRFTMDIARRETTLADVMAAYLMAARRPQPREIIDFYCNHQQVSPIAAWRGLKTPPDASALSHAGDGVRLAQAAMQGEYHDVHCSVFTPVSFVNLMVALSQIGMIWFSCRKLQPTLRGELDFFLDLRADDNREAIEASWRQAARDLVRVERRDRWRRGLEKMVFAGVDVVRRKKKGVLF